MIHLLTHSGFGGIICKFALPSLGGFSKFCFNDTTFAMLRFDSFLFPLGRITLLAKHLMGRTTVSLRGD